jgi:predicted dehydrogenase
VARPRACLGVRGFILSRMPQTLSRRRFLRQSSIAAAAAFSFPSILRAQQDGQSPNRRLNVALVGVGGRGRASLKGVSHENIVAFCDVDEERAGDAFVAAAREMPEQWERHQHAPRFSDYRRMFDQLGNQIDAVTIATPDHMHFPIAMAALSLGKHVFCEKPLTHTVEEARRLTKFAAEKKVVTQMGNQGHTGDGCRLLKEWHDAGVLGEVREVSSWTDRPGRWWPFVDSPPDHSKMIPVCPPTLNWDAWLGVAAERPYDPSYVPFKWRSWWDFGTGAFGDIACHTMDGAYWALNLGAPTAVEAVSSGTNDHGSPRAAMVKMDFPARGSLPPVRYTWYDGGLTPMLPAELEEGRKLHPEAGTLVHGSKATALCDFYYGSVRIIPEARMRELAPTFPAPTIPRVEGGPHAEWLRAIKGEGPKPGSSFDYSGPLTETVLLANAAIRAQRRIEWDAAAMRITNLPYANQYLTKTYRAGWGV